MTTEAVSPWHYLVDSLVAQGELVRPVAQQLVHKDNQHLLTFSEQKKSDDACCRVKDWILSEFQ